MEETTPKRASDNLNDSYSGSASLVIMDPDPRIEEVKRRFESRSLQALIVSSPPNIRYLANYNLIVGTAMLAVPHSGEPILLISNKWEFERAKLRTQIKDVRYTQDFGRDIGRLLGTKGKVGISGWASFPAPVYLSIHESHLGLHLEDASGLVEELRMVKSPAEIASMRKAARLVDIGMAEGIKAARARRSEVEIARAAEVAMKGAGAEELFPSTVGAGERTTEAVPKPTERKTRRGELVLIDLSATSDGYWGDISRTVGVQGVGADAKDICSVVLEMQDAALKSIKPGVRASEIHAVARRIAKESGYSDNLRHYTGHSLGLEAPERPFLENDRTELRTGMVLAVEPGLYVSNVGGVRIEDMVLVTETGARRLTHTNREL